MTVGRRHLVLVVAVVAAAAGAAVLVARDGGDGGSGDRMAPELAGPTIDGGTLRLDDYLGRPVLVNFWASWCKPCTNELPRLNALHARGVAVVGVNVAEGRRTAATFAEEAGVTWPSVHDPDQHVADRWQVGRGLPQTFAVDAGGRVRKRHFGEASDADLAELVAAASAPTTGG